MAAADPHVTPLERLQRRVVGFFVRLLLGGVYVTILGIVRVASVRPKRRPPPVRRLLVIGTFHNDGWFLAHVRPLARSGFDEVILVTDAPRTPIEHVRFMCPPVWLSRLLGRAAAKFVWTFGVGLRYRPTLYMGYYILPCALIALLVGRLLGGGTCYQQTGGWVEILGGGYRGENPLLSRLGRASPRVERLALALTRQFDLVVIRGTGGRRFLADRGVDERVEIITGSFIPRAPTTLAERPYDLVFVGRLSARKRPLLFLEIVEKVMASIPAVSALVIGGGSEYAAIERRIAERGLADRVSLLGPRDDVCDWLLRSKILVHTSDHEGLSIAVAEAMGCGTPVVVSDVGDLADLVENGANGWRVAPDDVAAYTERITQLLSDRATWEEFSRHAADAARALASFDEVAARWRRCLAPWSARSAAQSIEPTAPPQSGPRH